MLTFNISVLGLGRTRAVGMGQCEFEAGPDLGVLSWEVMWSLGRGAAALAQSWKGVESRHEAALLDFRKERKKMRETEERP